MTMREFTHLVGVLQVPERPILDRLVVSANDIVSRHNLNPVREG